MLIVRTFRIAPWASATAWLARAELTLSFSARLNSLPLCPSRARACFQTKARAPTVLRSWVRLVKRSIAQRIASSRWRWISIGGGSGGMSFIGFDLLIWLGLVIIYHIAHGRSEERRVGEECR